MQVQKAPLKVKPTPHDAQESTFPYIYSSYQVVKVEDLLEVIYDFM